MNDLIHVTSSPHVREKMDTRKIMLCVIISLLPATFFGIYNFGVKALLIIFLSIFTSVLSEWVFDRITYRKNTIGDLSAVVTGLLLGLNLPHTVSWFIPVLGSIFAIFIVKMLFGGLGQNFMNPALGARCFLVLSFASQMTTFTYDGVTGATPLTQIKQGETVNTIDMLLGTCGGTIGETSALCLLIGGIFLILMGIISLRIPATYIITLVLFMGAFGPKGFDGTYLLQQVFGGGLMIGAFFMATDYVTCPITPKGQIVYGIILGVLTGVFRVFGQTAEGVSYAIIFTNCLVPLIEKFTIPKAFGINTVKEEH
ncbi:MAG: RnfABCDGE type electron transport complex subunit D [Lachnospiraceae bacterium]|nr:RnfABCDGE type electron transport complex subunit D [Lachnospiraceae bacterium]